MTTKHFFVILFVRKLIMPCREMLSVKINNIFKPIFFVFLLNGIDLNKSAKKWRILTFTIFFHTMFVLMILFQIFCLITVFRWNLGMTISLKMIAFILWRFVWTRNKKKIGSLIEMLQLLKVELSLHNYRELQKYSRFAAVFVAFVIVLHPAALALRYIIPHQGDISTGFILHSLEDLNTATFVTYVVLVEFTAIYVNISVT